VKNLIVHGKTILNSRVLIMGVTFKENVSDLRNSKVFDVISELQTYGVKVDAVDPLASIKEVKNEYGFDMVKEVGSGYDAVIVAVSHDEYIDLKEDYFKSICTEKPILVDIKGIYKDKIHDISYWSL
jgi:UDP-N-acetyl-D-galactosamine dehydrogenase